MRKRLPLILASASPRRKTILREHGYRFRIHPSQVSERHPSGLKPAALVRYLAAKKARAVAPGFAHAVVLGADTLVFINGRILGKPRNAAEGARMLKTLAGRWQTVITGVAVAWDGGRRLKIGHAVSRVKMRRLSDEEIRRAAARHLDKAGGYAVQEKKDAFVEQIRGDYDNVVGLPMRVVGRLLRDAAQALTKRLGHHVHFQS